MHMKDGTTMVAIHGAANQEVKQQKLQVLHDAIKLVEADQCAGLMVMITAAEHREDGQCGTGAVVVEIDEAGHLFEHVRCTVQAVQSQYDPLAKAVMNALIAVVEKSEDEDSSTPPSARH